MQRLVYTTSRATIVAKRSCILVSKPVIYVPHVTKYKTKPPTKSEKSKMRITPEASVCPPGSTNTINKLRIKSTSDVTEKNRQHTLLMKCVRCAWDLLLLHKS